jgi:hypothetical protein
LGHGINVEFVVSRVPRHCCADGEAALRVEVEDESEERAILAFDPFVNRVVVLAASW